MKALIGSLGFFSTIPIGRDVNSFEALRRNLWIMPITGAVVGTIIAIPTFFLKMLSNKALFLSVLIYLAVEGLNHVDGLSDFGDAIFAPGDRRFQALKDTKTGVGGTVTVCIYMFTLMYAFMSIESVVVIVNSQIMAKYGMLLLLTTTKPLWNGLASCMMEFANVRDLVLGSVIVVILTGVCSLIYPRVILINPILLVLALAYRSFVIRSFGGVNGDIIGALNCIVFASGLILATQKW